MISLTYQKKYVNIFKRDYMHLSEITRLMETVKTENDDYLECINKKRLDYINSYPNPTLSHKYNIELGEIITDCMNEVLKENEWWIQNKDKGLTKYEFYFEFTESLNDN